MNFFKAILYWLVFRNNNRVYFMFGFGANATSAISAEKHGGAS
jgi:hypothetical protein